LTLATKRDYPAFMTDEKPWQDQYEDDGITLGPEEALQREIQKSKSLKVERLKLKDQIEKLRYEVEHLKQENNVLKSKMTDRQTTQNPALSNTTRQTAGWAQPAIVILAILLACAILTLFIFR
jgi:hypothetical protein